MKNLYADSINLVPKNRLPLLNAATTAVASDKRIVLSTKKLANLDLMEDMNTRYQWILLTRIVSD
eukprot:9017464-Ditylum_brightwellii.AAC.1